MHRKDSCLRRIRAWFLSLFAGALLPVACSPTIDVEGGLPDRDPELAYRLVSQERGLLLDVRSVSEYRGLKIEGSRNIPIDQLASRLGEIEKLVQGDKELPIVVYCAAGARAAQAKRVLLQAGYKKVTNLGSIRNWP